MDLLDDLVDAEAVHHMMLPDGPTRSRQTKRKDATAPKSEARESPNEFPGGFDESAYCMVVVSRTEQKLLRLQKRFRRFRRREATSST